MTYLIEIDPEISTNFSIDAMVGYLTLRLFKKKKIDISLRYANESETKATAKSTIQLMKIQNT